jgi:hypothetical protein
MKSRQIFNKPKPNRGEIMKKSLTILLCVMCCLSHGRLGQGKMSLEKEYSRKIDVDIENTSENYTAKLGFKSAYLSIILGGTPYREMNSDMKATASGILVSYPKIYRSHKSIEETITFVRPVPIEKAKKLVFRLLPKSVKKINEKSIGLFTAKEYSRDIIIEFNWQDDMVKSIRAYYDKDHIKEVNNKKRSEIEDYFKSRAKSKSKIRRRR